MEMDFQALAGHTLNRMRLMVEGALVLYESNTGNCYPQMLAEGRTEEALTLCLPRFRITHREEMIDEIMFAFPEIVSDTHARIIVRIH